MAYVAAKRLKFDGVTVEAGQLIPSSIKWKGNSLRSCINLGHVSVVPDTDIQAGEGATAPTPVSFQCQVCGKQNKSQRGLSLHAKTHAKG